MIGYLNIFGILIINVRLALFLYLIYTIKLLKVFTT